MKLQLDSRKDLLFVLDGVQAAVVEQIREQCLHPEQQQPKGQDWRLLKQRYLDKTLQAGTEDISFEEAIRQQCLQHLDAILERVSRNCQVNGRDWWMHSNQQQQEDDCVQEMEPRNESLAQQVDALQEECDRWMVKVTQQRMQAPRQCIQITESRVLSSPLRLPSSENKSVTNNNNNNNNKVDTEIPWNPATTLLPSQEEFLAMQQRMLALQESLPAIVARLERYQSFVSDELKDAQRYELHRQRLAASPKELEGGSRAPVDPFTARLLGRMEVLNQQPLTQFL